jgi:hypothetical protein
MPKGSIGNNCANMVGETLSLIRSHMQNVGGPVEARKVIRGKSNEGRSRFAHFPVIASAMLLNEFQSGARQASRR